MRNIKESLNSKLAERLAADEEGHAYAYGGGSLIAIILIILLLVWLL